MNLFRVHERWFVAGSNAGAPVIAPCDVEGGGGKGDSLRVDIARVSEARAFSLLSACPEQQLNGRHRFSVYLRGERGNEVVWLSHASEKGQVTSRECKLSQQWTRFEIEYRASEAGKQHLAVGVDLRESGQRPRPEQRIFLHGAELHALEEPRRPVNPARAQQSQDGLAIHRVVVQDDAWRTEEKEQPARLLCDRTGAALSVELLKAWSPDRLVELDPELFVLEVTRRADDHQQAWLFEGGLRLRARAVRPNGDPQCPVPSGGAEAHIAARVLGRAFVDILGDAMAFRNIPIARDLAKLRPGTRSELLSLVWSAMGAPTVATAYPDAGLRQVQGLNWLEVTQRALETGRLEIPALSREGVADGAATIITDDYYKAAIQLRDAQGKAPWVILLDAFTTQHRYHHESVKAVVFPESWSFIQLSPQWGRHEVKGWLEVALRHLLKLGDDAAAWKSKPFEMAVLGRSQQLQHLGHQIWNTNSTLLRVVEDAARKGAAPPTFWDIAAAAGVEIYGPIEDFFPELAGRVKRSAATAGDAFVEAAKEGKTLLFDVFHEVPSRLRTRMQRTIAQDPAIQSIYRAPETRALVDAVSGRPIMIFGVRLQNRTVPDLIGFYVKLAERLSARAPFTVILDGMTTNEAGVIFKAFSQSADEGLLLTRERQFEEEFRKRVAHLPVTVISTIGLSMRRALFWHGFAHLFVAPHGTGIAKYRWVHNIPGLILASEQNVRFGFALKIYESDGNVEDAAELLYTDPSEVVDLLPAGRAFDENGRMADPFWLGLVNHSFEIRDKPRLLNRIADLFERCSTQKPTHGDLWCGELDAAGAETE